MRALLTRNLRLAIRSGGHWALGLIFFALFLALCSIALGGQTSTLRPFTAPLTWLAFIFAALLSAPQIFRPDLADGTLEQLKLSGVGLTKAAAAALISFGLFSLMPLIIITPLLAQFFGADANLTIGTIVSLLAGLPAITIYMGVSGALLCGRESSGFLAILICAPLLVPILIFGVAAANAYVDNGFAASELHILFGLSLIASAIGFPAITAALAANLES